jgi:hypothetical protein
MSVGERVINQIVASNLFTAKCQDSPSSSCLIVWSANAAEQLSAMLSECESKRLVDLESTRFGIQQIMDRFDEFLVAADKTDEMALNGMRATLKAIREILLAYDAELHMSDSR